ncbi:hypothetical protein BDZ88DRAFT_296983 [Geranomyces variabilis]|nr:hypothetical protein BDZ88DRAFT_296983 [Geranomyces variabilis]
MPVPRPPPLQAAYLLSILLLDGRTTWPGMCNRPCLRRTTRKTNMTNLGKTNSISKSSISSARLRSQKPFQHRQYRAMIALTSSIRLLKTNSRTRSFRQPRQQKKRHGMLQK